MQKDLPQHPEVLKEIARLKEYFETTPILIKDWKEGCMVVKDIPEFIRLELNAAATFNPRYPFNPPLKRLQQLEHSIRQQLTISPIV
jgi:hypothetical protein